MQLSHPVSCEPRRTVSSGRPLSRFQKASQWVWWEPHAFMHAGGGLKNKKRKKEAEFIPVFSDVLVKAHFIN